MKGKLSPFNTIPESAENFSTNQEEKKNIQRTKINKHKHSKWFSHFNRFNNAEKSNKKNKAIEKRNKISRIEFC